MVNDIERPTQSQDTSKTERSHQMREITRKIIAGEAVDLSEDRPHLVARRNARWARRAAHA